MTEEEFIEEIAQLPGVGESKARALYEAGYETVDELREATEDDLTEVEGVGPRIAEAIVEGLEAREEPAEEQEIEVVEEEPEEPEEEEVEAVEGAEHAPKIQPDLPDEVERALAIREAVREDRPSFVRQNSFQHKRLDDDTWRRPHGEESKQRIGKRYRPAAVKVGHRSPKKARGLHPSGFEEVLVHNPDDLDEVDPDRQAARIGGSVGGRKREAIEDRAQEMGIRVLNPTQEESS